MKKEMDVPSCPLPPGLAACAAAYDGGGLWRAALLRHLRANEETLRRRVAEDGALAHALALDPTPLEVRCGAMRCKRPTRARGGGVGGRVGRAAAGLAGLLFLSHARPTPRVAQRSVGAGLVLRSRRRSPLHSYHVPTIGRRPIASRPIYTLPPRAAALLLGVAYLP